MPNSIKRKFGCEDISESKEFLSVHPKEPKEGYYRYDDSLYYYLPDTFGDNRGWYLYDDYDWTYYADYNDSNIVPKDLYYSSNNYSTVYDYNNDFFDGTYPFSNTDWYETRNSLEEYWGGSSESSSGWDWDFDWDYDTDWSYDSDWNWDSGSSWDSNWSDWDSDW